MNKLLKLSLIFFMLVILPSCGIKDGELKSVDSKEVDDLSPNNGGQVTIPMGNIDTLNPLLTKNENYFQISKLIFDQLFVVQNNGKIVPSIAEHYSLTNEGYTLSVTIRDNVFWEDGNKLTARDIADTFNALKHLPEDSAYYQMLRHSVTSSQDFAIENFARAVVFDEKNVDFQFEKPYGNILEILTFPILPSHIMNADQMVSKDDFSVIGSGPFLLENYEKNKSLVLVKNSNYHQNVPYIEKINVKIMGNKEKEKQAFEAGQLDLLNLEDYTWDKYRANKGLKIETIETNNLEILALNMENPIFQGESGLALRKAIFRGINKNRIIDSLYLSQAIPTSFLLNKELNAGLSLEDEVYYNLETSNEILRKAGFKDSNKDGWIEFPSGETVQLEIFSNHMDYLKKTETDLIIDDLKALGIQAKAREVLEQEEGINLESLVKSGNYQIALFEVSFSAVPDLASILHGKSISHQNLSRVNDPILNELLEKLSLTSNDLEKSQILNKINRRFLELCPYVPLFFKQEVLIRDGKISQDLNPSIFDLYDGLKDIHVPKRAN